METRIQIVGNSTPIYVSKLGALGTILDCPSFNTLTHFDDGTLIISFPERTPVYVYEDMGMIFIAGRPSGICGPLLASWIPPCQHTRTVVESICCRKPEIAASGICNGCKEHADFATVCLECGADVMLATEEATV